MQPAPDHLKPAVPAAVVVSVDEARLRLAAALSAVAGDEQVALVDGLRRVLVEPVLAQADIPACAVSAMDGYALAAGCQSSAPFALHVAGTALAGHPADVGVTAVTTVRIMTGAVVPEGADTVVMQEDAIDHAGSVRFETMPRIGSHVRRPGEDMRQGDIALAAGRILGAGDIQRAANLGHATLRVRRRVQVALFSTGDEIRPIGAPLQSGAVYDSNRQFLLAALAGLNLSVLDLGIVADAREPIEAALRRACDSSDLLITTGGASQGDADYVSNMVEQRGQTIFAGVAMKPGRPTRLTLLERSTSTPSRARLAVLSLPGSPMAMLTAFYVFALEAISLLQGVADTSTGPARRFQARLNGYLRPHPQRAEYLPACLSYDAGGAVVSLNDRANHATAPRQHSIDVLIELSQGSLEKRPGDAVVFIML